MKLKKILNNNFLIVSDDQNQEHIVVGRGIGFLKQKGDIIDEEIIEYAESNLNKKLNDSIYITLTDHINFIKTRYDRGL